MEPKFFPAPTDLRKWFEKNHNKETELLVGFYKVGSGKASINWSESVDQALCFGWIDGVRKSIDAESYSIRFTPRKKNSIWSAININKVEQLSKAGLMKPEGLAAYSHRQENKSKIYAYENELAAFSEDFEKQFRKNIKAWDFFQAQPPSYKKVSVHRVMSARQEKTKISRLASLIKASEEGKRL